MCSEPLSCAVSTDPFKKYLTQRVPSQSGTGAPLKFVNAIGHMFQRQESVKKLRSVSQKIEKPFMQSYDLRRLHLTYWGISDTTQ